MTDLRGYQAPFERSPSILEGILNVAKATPGRVL